MRLRLLSYNIHKCIGGIDRRFNPYRVGEVIGHYSPDLVFLQEVDAEARRSGYFRLVDLLGDMLRYRHRTWFGNVNVRTGGQYGNAILSRHPLLHTQNVDLTIPPRKRRSVVHAHTRVRLPDGRTRTVHLYNMHLGLSGRERKVQLETFLASHPFANLHPRAPIIVAGDLNDVWGELGAQKFVPVGFRGLDQPLRTFPAYAPLRALDAVYVRGDIDVVHARTASVRAARYASDHLPLIADLELRG